MNQRYFIEISYDGGNYHGWQIQPNATCVQELINSCLSTILRQDVAVLGAGRTDAGVHAKQMFAHFESDSILISESNFEDRCNSFLPDDISVNSIRKVTADAHCRFDATARTYEYFIVHKKDPFFRSKAWFVYKDLNVNAMNEAAQVLLDYKDFTSFSKSQTQTKTNKCVIHLAEWKPTLEGLVFTIKADRFLRNMVRAIVGTLVEIGVGKLTLEDFRKVIESKNRSEAGTSVPAHALFLSKIEYPDQIWK